MRRPRKADRIKEHSSGLASDIRDWIDLKITLIELEIWQNVKARKHRYIIFAIVVALGLTAVVFMLAAASFGLGDVLGHEAWGFLTVGGVLGVVASLVYVVKIRDKKASKTGAALQKTVKLPLTDGQDQA